MTVPRHIAVIDIGKTNAKLALVDRETLRERAVVTRANRVQPGPPWPHFDVEGHWEFLLAGLRDLHAKHRVDAVSITTHGASVVLLDAAGRLAAPILDYEHNGPDQIAAQYDAIRPPFAQTGSPRLAGGLNVGAQLHWMFQQDPALHARTAHILTYPQYWGHRLTGELACDVTSIGCHTDLWQPRAGAFSDLVQKLDIEDKIAPVRNANTVLGSIRPEIAAATGLAADTPVAVGIHDSNASLYPHVLTQTAPFSVVSTGTWVVVMSVGGAQVDLDPARDTLINVNALGQPVPSARFMGGREYEIVQAGHTTAPSAEDAAQVIADELMLLPAVEPGSGPFQGQQMRWHGAEPKPGSGLRTAVLSFYLAMMTDACLRLCGADGPIILEGPFGRNALFKTMLAAASGRDVLQSQTATGTSIGAALLFDGPNRLSAPVAAITAPIPEAYRDYATAWRKRVEQTG